MGSHMEPGDLPTFNDSATSNIEAAKKQHRLFILYLSLSHSPLLLPFLTSPLIFSLSLLCITILDEKEHQSEGKGDKEGEGGRGNRKERGRESYRA